MTIAAPLPPAVFGLPAKFASWYPDQFDAMCRIHDATTRFVGLVIPTGGGKTLTYMAASRLHLPRRTVVLTASKGLQDQVVEDGYDGLVDVRGQGAYPCKALYPGGEWEHLVVPTSQRTCDEGPCHVGLPCSLREAGCAHYDRVRLGVNSRTLSTNYACWLAQKRYGQGLGAPDLLVLDEAHQAVNELSNALTVTLDKWLCSAIGLVPPGGEDLAIWKSWATFHADRLKGLLDVKAVSTSGHDVKYRARLKRAERILRAMMTMTPMNWIPDHTDSAWVFEILNPAKHAEEYLFQGARKIVLTSATLTEKTLGLLGVPADQVTFHAYPSRFPIARRPVYIIPTARVDAKMSHGSKMAVVHRIDQIVAQRPHVKGIVHAVSYARAKFIVGESSEHPRFLMHGNKPGDVAATVKDFKQQPDSRVLISPSIVTGWDFPHAACRFQILPKLPFPDTRSKILQARSAIDPDYLPYLMIQALVQSVGRGMRAPNDWCETFILDDHIRWVLGKYKALIPHWFREAIKTTTLLPKPLTFDA